MEGISDIKIIGLDDRRPPRIRPEPYIDVIFKLSHKAPPEWCRDFNGLLAKHPTSPKIKDSEGLYIEAWVRTPDEIPILLDTLKKKINECSTIYIERIEAAFRSQQTDTSSADENSGEQGQLNKILAELNF